MADPLSQNHSSRWWGWLVVLSVLALIALVVVGQPAIKKKAQIAAGGIQARPPFIGDLGGVPVEIPHYYVDAFITYDGDPDFWGGKFHTRPKQSERTYSSKMSSFGIEARYPYMVGKSTNALYQEWLEDRDSPSSKWIDIRIASGEDYQEGGLHRIAEGWIDPYPDAFRNYTRMPDKVIGGEVMEVYMVLGKNPKTQVPYRHNADDIFIQRDKQTAQVKTYIKCSSRNVPTPPCTHYFELEPKMAARAIVSYPRQMLPYWKDIQAKSKALVYSFEKR